MNDGMNDGVNDGINDGVNDGVDEVDGVVGCSLLGVSRSRRGVNCWNMDGEDGIEIVWHFY